MSTTDMGSIAICRNKRRFSNKRRGKYLANAEIHAARYLLEVVANWGGDMSADAGNGWPHSALRYNGKKT